ncbi:hypothetical protein D3C80_1111280 [compost metagenome]
MPHFMSKREHTIQIVFMIKQNERMRAVSAPAVRTGAFAFIFVNVDPAIAEAVAQNFKVVVTKRLETLKNHFFRLII